MIGPLAVVAIATAPPQSRFFDDGGRLFSAETIDAEHDRIRLLRARTGREILVVTVPALHGASIRAAAERAFAAHHPHGALLFFSRAERRGEAVAGPESRQALGPGDLRAIDAAMDGSLRAGAYDAAVVVGVDLLRARYGAETPAVRGASPLDSGAIPFGSAAGVGPAAPPRRGLSWPWAILLYVTLFAVLDLARVYFFGPRVPRAAE